MVLYLEVYAALDENFRLKLVQNGVTEKVANVSVKLRQSFRIKEEEREEEMLRQREKDSEVFLTPGRAPRKCADNYFLELENVYKQSNHFVMVLQKLFYFCSCAVTYFRPRRCHS